MGRNEKGKEFCERIKDESNFKDKKAQKSISALEYLEKRFNCKKELKSQPLIYRTNKSYQGNIRRQTTYCVFEQPEEDDEIDR